MGQGNSPVSGHDSDQGEQQGSVLVEWTGSYSKSGKWHGAKEQTKYMAQVISQGMKDRQPGNTLTINLTED